MNKEEQEVLKTFKSGLGLTSAEREILANYIDKLQKENEELSQSNFQFLEINQKLIEEKPIIKELTGKELNLLEEIDKQQKEIEETAKRQLIITTNYWKNKIRNKTKELEENEDCTYCNNTCSKYYVCNVLKELLGE